MVINLLIGPIGACIRKIKKGVISKHAQNVDIERMKGGTSTLLTIVILCVFLFLFNLLHALLI